jgi:DNA (cytosine-5)-methyltransferase 1
MPKVISLFAGCGGSSLGYQLAGCNVIASIERDANAIEVYKTNFPKTTLWEGDISEIDPHELLRQHGLQPGEVDILDGSPPCQGFSMIGKRRILDPRNQLVIEYIRFLHAIRPKAFCMENVPGLIVGDMRYIFQNMINALKSEGYVVQVRILNASHYGVPQDRKRVIILGFREDIGCVPTHPKPTNIAVSFRQAVKGLTAHELTCVPTGQAMNLAQSLRPGQSGAKLHKRYGHKPNDFSLIRLAWDKPAPTVCKTVRLGQCGLLHPEEDRFLSIGELKRVCSFPDNFVLSGPFEARWGRLGNAVPPLLSQAIAESVLHQLGGK